MAGRTHASPPGSSAGNTGVNANGGTGVAQQVVTFCLCVVPRANLRLAWARGWPPHLGLGGARNGDRTPVNGHSFTMHGREMTTAALILLFVLSAPLGVVAQEEECDDGAMRRCRRDGLEAVEGRKDNDPCR
ncbi:hypothetical protein CDAR_533281 [Caerostris darwini]|uniref:Uncharacterized protein n=1 Tax=Caerostris darwini TaxID=1538125 RepID=A0AAV4WW02_9ARAC|nr:hypothetical protein CDAR_533281 [Caerostris darwini]